MSDVQRRHEHFMRLAIEEAQSAANRGDVPVGCVIVRGGEVVAASSNEIELSGDPIRHAEMNAISLATEKVGAKFLDDCTIYVTLEPCAMCAGAIVLARIPNLVYGASDEKAGAVRSVFEIADDSRLNHRCTIRTGVLARECSELLSKFFEAQRKRVIQPVEPIVPDLQARLTLVPTPIGNLEDITIRSLKVLQRSDIILCEDTRTTGRLLRHLKIHPKRLLSNNDYNEHERASSVVQHIHNGLSVALVSDAGMPGISDPGYRIVEACIKAGIRVEALPGPSALTTAIAASGLPTDRICFVGFPPHKKGRKRFLTESLNMNATIVIFESPFRIEQLLSEIIELVSPLTSIVIARELSKVHEEYIRGPVAEVLQQIITRGGIRGECIVLVDARKERAD
jgi:16S rRNA (cytidine1402-2'-O)-methyltransferase